ncbi:MAG: carboxylesterase family protein [Boseongicola sp.]
MLKALLVAVTTFLAVTIASADRLADLSYGRHPAQVLDVYTPESAVKAPVIVMLHGGAWAFGDKRNRQVWRAKTDYWGPRGYVFVSVNTRLLPDADPIEQTQDLAGALAFIQRNAQRWGGDSERIVLMGHSAGAHVAALLAVRDDLRRAAGLQPWSGTILLDTAALDIALIMGRQPGRLYRNAFGSDPAFWSAASPIMHVSAREGPFLIVCSSKRRETCPVGRQFGRQGEVSGVATLVLPVALRHGPINGEIGKSSAYTKSIDDWITRVLR